jgi:hypothetical protein
MAMQAVPAPRFVRRTQLGPGEYRKNFRQIDAEVISAVTSAEADRVTPLMSKIYLRLISAPAEFWEREGVLYLTAREEAGRQVKASKVLYELLGVASATAHKALSWMHGEGVIGYFAGKNGAGIRIFLNRASSSIGRRGAAAGEKILPFAGGSGGAARGSSAEPAFNDSFAGSEGLEENLNPRAPKNGAGQAEVVNKFPALTPRPQQAASGVATLPPSAEELAGRLLRELKPSLESIASKAAAREHERTREWLESKGLPKAARVAQREAYNVLRQHGLVLASANTRDAAGVGRPSGVAEGPRPLTPEEVREMAEACVTVLEVHGQAVEVTLSALDADAGGCLLAGDLSQVRARAERLARGKGSGP